MTSGKSRVDFIDLYRGIGIILMVMAHIGFGNIFDKYVHAFHMPMFFFVSGYFFKHKGFYHFLTRKVKTLLLPYLLWATIFYYTWKMIGYNVEISLPYMLLHMNAEHIVIANPLWFLCALFISELIFYGIEMIALSSVRTVTILLLAFLPEFPDHITMPQSVAPQRVMA